MLTRSPRDRAEAPHRLLWGECSLSNHALPADAGAFAAYLVDAETGRCTIRSQRQRGEDLEIARVNIFGAGRWTSSRRAAARVDRPEVVCEEVGQRYQRTMDEITKSSRRAGGRHDIEGRIRRLKRVGLRRRRVACQRSETGVTWSARRWSSRYQPAAAPVDRPGREENQARRMLNDLDAYGRRAT